MLIGKSGARAGGVPGFSTLYLTMFVIAAGNLAMMSIFPAIARASDIPDAVMVAVQSLSAGLSIFTTPYWAGRSDQVGRKSIILLGVSGFTLASLLTAGAIILATHRLVPLVLAVAALIGSRAIFGSFGLAAAPAIQAHIADETAPAERTRTLASLYSANGLGSIVGPGIAPFLILPVIGLAGPQALFALAGVLTLIAVYRGLPATPVVRPVSKIEAVSRWEILRQPWVWPFVAYMVVLSGCQAANLQILGFVIMDRARLDPIAAQPLIGGALMAGAAAAVAMQLGILRRRRMRSPTMMVVGVSIVIAGNLLMTLAGSYPLVVSSFLLTSTGYAFAMPAGIAGASLASDPQRQGAVAGLISAAASSGLLLAPLVAILIYHWSATGPFIAIGMTLALLLMTIIPRCRAALRAQHRGWATN